MICDPGWADGHDAHRVSTNQIRLIFSFSYWECPLAVCGVLFVWVCQLAGLCSPLRVSTQLFTRICVWLLHQQRSFLIHSFFWILVLLTWTRQEYFLARGRVSSSILSWGRRAALDS